MILLPIKRREECANYYLTNYIKIDNNHYYAWRIKDNYPFSDGFMESPENSFDFTNWLKYI